MLALIFALPFVVALLCLALDRAVPTRWLGLGASAALLLAGALLLLARAQGGLPLALPPQVWAQLDDAPVRLALRLDGASWPLALLELLGGALGVLALALALPSTLRGFGGLFAAVLLMLLAVLLGLANDEPLLLPFAWALVALLGFVALRVSGATADASGLPLGLLAGLFGTLTLLAAALALRGGAVTTPAALICWSLAGLLALGAPPFHALVEEGAAAPAALAGLIWSLGLPLLGGYALIRFAAGQVAALPPAWNLIMTLLGLLTLLVCAGGATGATRMRALLGWQLSAQMGLVLVAVGQGGAGLAVVALALLANAAVTTLACSIALAVLERRAGTDDMGKIGMPGPLVLPGLAFLIAAASAVGLPGTWGLWARRWLFDDLLRAAPWAVAPLLAGSALMALAYVAPLAAFWRAAPADEHGQPGRPQPAPLVVAGPALAALPLVILGVVPQLAWQSWLGETQRTLAPSVSAAAPALPGPLTQIGSALAVAALVLLAAVLGTRRAQRAPLDPDTQVAGVLAPQALGQSLRGLAWLGSPANLFHAAWEGLLSLSRAARRGLALFEQRYYLAGLLIALIVVIMLLI